MTALQIVVLAFVQGFTEFLPISSSGHLVLVPYVMHWPDQGLPIDIAVHVGSLVAVLIYFRADLSSMVAGLFDWREPGLLAHPGRRLAALLLAGTVPILFAGALLQATIGAESFRNPSVIAWTTLIYGVLLYLADRFGPRTRTLGSMDFGGAVLIGCAQALALVPGTSRSGATMTAARLLGFERTDAARFSFLLSIPAIFAASLFVIADAVRTGNESFGVDALLAGLLTVISAYLAIGLLMAWVRRSSFAPFAIYRVLLAILLFWFF